MDGDPSDATPASPPGAPSPGEVFRIDSDGPAGIGLTEWDALDPATLASGTPVQRGYFYESDDAQGYCAGVWDCTAYDDAPGPYPVDEYMFLLEGNVIMELPDGSATMIRAGEAFVLPRGLNCQWKMPGYVRKIFMIVEGAGGAASANPSLTRVTKPSLAPLPVGAADPDALPVAQAQTVFLSADGRMSVVRRDYPAALSGPVLSGAHRLITVLDGRMDLNGARFEAGESYYVRAGAVPEVSVTPGTRLIEARFHPPA